MRWSKISLAIAVLVGFIAGSLLGGLWQGSASGQTQPDTDSQRHITVTGHGEVQAQPDMATVIVGVETEAPTAQEALERNNQQMNNLLAALRDLGIADEDLQTRSFNIYPHFDDQPGGENEIVGYVVRNTVAVTVRDLSQLGIVLDTAVAEGANIVHGINFSIADTSELRQQALERAFEDARTKAEQLAQVANVQLQQILVINEGGGVAPPRPFAGGQAVESEVPVEPGQQAVTATVQVVFAIE